MDTLLIILFLLVVPDSARQRTVQILALSVVGLVFLVLLVLLGAKRRRILVLLGMALLVAVLIVLNR